MRIDMNRRNFLRGMSGLAALGTGGCFSIGRGGSGKVRLAAVGVMGKGFSDWTPMLKTGLVEMVAFCDADYTMREKAQAMLIAEGIDFDMYSVPFYTDYRRLLDDAGILGIEAMTVSTPDHAHAAIAIGAMKQGINVYVQKPLVRTLWELEYFNKTAREYGVITQMGNQGSALNTMRRCTEVIQSGIIGEVKEVHVWTNRPVWPQGLLARETTLGKADPIPSGLNWDAWLGVAPKRAFKGAYPAGKKGYDPWNLCPGVFHQFSWRGFFDFGCGAFGDMACHTMNLPFRGLELGVVKSAELLRIEEKNDVAYPTKSVVKMTYAARESKVRPGVQLPECTLYWYDGQLKPELEKLPPVMASLGELSSGGCVLIGSKGVVSMVDDYGGQCNLAMNGEKKFTDLFAHEAAKAVPRSIPYRLDASTKIDQGGDGTGAPAVSADGHYVEFVQAIRGEGPRFEQTHSRCFSDIDYSIPIMEGILVGCIAQRVEGRLDWDSAAYRFTNSNAANAFIKPTLRAGYVF